MDDLWFKAAVGLLGVLMTITFELIRRLFHRQDRLDATKADKDTTRDHFDDLIRRLDSHIMENKQAHRDNRDTVREISKSLQDTNHHLSQTNISLATIATKLESHIQHNGGQQLGP